MGFESHVPGDSFSLNHQTREFNLNHLNHLLAEEIEPRYPIFLQINEYELHRSDILNARLDPVFLAMSMILLPVIGIFGTSLFFNGIGSYC